VPGQQIKQRVTSGENIRPQVRVLTRELIYDNLMLCLIQKEYKRSLGGEENEKLA
jgi:hypothetical protein